MPYLILGGALLAGVLLAGRWFITADPKTLVKTFKWLLIGSIITIAIFFLITGRVAWAIAALPALLPWFIRIRRAARTAKAFHRMSQRGGGRPSGQTSAVNTRYLHMELDHDSGAMWGTVVSGAHAGSDLHDLNDATIVQLLAECQSNDPESAQILEAYLDRQRPNWRDTAGAQRNHTHRDGPANNTAGYTSGTMSRAEAYEVLGLEDGAPMDTVREAHRRLIAHLHPDKGGSTFLAAKVNQAKDVLLNE